MVIWRTQRSGCCDQGPVGRGRDLNSSRRGDGSPHQECGRRHADDESPRPIRLAANERPLESTGGCTKPNRRVTLYDCLQCRTRATKGYAVQSKEQLLTRDR